MILDLQIALRLTLVLLEAEVYEGTLIIVSNDPAKQPELRIPVIGRGTLNACPIAAVE